MEANAITKETKRFNEAQEEIRDSDNPFVTPEGLTPLLTWDDFKKSIPAIIEAQQDYIEIVTVGKRIIKRDAEAGLDQNDVNLRYDFIQELVRSAAFKGFQL